MKISTIILLTVLVLGCGGGGEDKASSTIPAPGTPPTAKAPDEKAALDAIALFNEAQSLQFKRIRRYALTFDELVEARLLKAEPTAEETGYNFRVRPAADAQTYTLLATPASPAPAARHFFTDQTGTIRAEQGKDATVESPTVTK